MGKFGNFELSAEQRKALEFKNQRRAELRATYLKNMGDPHRHAVGDGGFLFDPAMQRFQAMRVSHYEHFKPTGKSFRMGFGLVILPIIGFAMLFRWERDGKEKRFRNGEVSYRDRSFKFV